MTTTPTVQTRPTAHDVVWSQLRPVAPRGLQPAPPAVGLMALPLPWVLGIRTAWTLPRSEQSPALARTHVEETCRTWRIRAVAYDLSVIVSELVTNALIHGKGAIRLHLEYDEARVWVNVTDEGQGAVQPYDTTPDDESGRGLKIVSELAQRYGVVLNDENTRVWACVEVPPPPAAPSLCAHVLTRWTWPVTPDMADRIYACVADTFTDWQAAPHQAALLAQLAAEYAGDVTKDSEHPCVAVSARIEGSLATVSAVPSADLEPVHTEDLPPQLAYTESAWGSADTAAGLCKWACVNLLTTGAAS